MAEAEVPEWLTRAETLAQERAAQALAGDGLQAGPRERKAVTYREALSERDWGRLMESGLDTDEFLHREE
eukprot:4718237-Prymnesium_polylepis.1